MKPINAGMDAFQPAGHAQRFVKDVPGAYPRVTRLYERTESGKPVLKGTAKSEADVKKFLEGA
jgi:hypothetical protein